MRRAVLLYNPASGARRELRLRVIESVAEALRQRGVQAEAVATEAPRSAGRQAAGVDPEVDTVFACGGDGTVHEVLQGLVTAPEIATGAPSKPALGVIPLGTANALARDLGLPLDPVAAVLAQIAYEPRTIPVGRVEVTTQEGLQTRYFAVMAGAGPHATLMYDMLTGGKGSLGRTAYYLRALTLFAEEHLWRTSRHRPPSEFTVELTEAGAEQPRQMSAVSAMAVRVASLGGLFHPLAVGGRLQSPTLRLIVVHPPALLSLPLWFGMSWAGLAPMNRWVETFDVSEFRCMRSLAEQSGCDVQADGEWLGRGDLRVSLLKDALRLLMPPLQVGLVTPQTSQRGQGCGVGAADEG